MSITRRIFLQWGAGLAAASQLPITLTGCGGKPTPDSYPSYDVDFIGLEGRLKRKYDAITEKGIEAA